MKNYFWNMFANIKNGSLAKKAFVYQKNKKQCQMFLKQLWSEGFILGYKICDENPDLLKIFLKYTDGKPVVSTVKLISKPGRRIYFSAKQIWKMDLHSGCIIFSTHRGLKTIDDCKKLNLGGEALVIIN